MHKILRIIVLNVLLSITMLGGMFASYAVELQLSQDSTQKVAVQSSNKESSSLRSKGFLSSRLTMFSSRTNQQIDSDKVLSNVKVFPNPVTEYINLSYRLNKDQVVKIKVMDALGNEVLTLLNQKVEAGNQNHSFEIQNRLSTGIYFVRVAVGTETVVKRISVI